MCRLSVGDDLLEQGVMAELDGTPNPALFKQALRKFEEVLVELRNLDARIGELADLDKANASAREPAFDRSVATILKNAGAFERASNAGLRYSNAAGAKPTPPKITPTDLSTLLASQREDIAVLIKQLEGTIDALRGAIPVAEKHQFAALMLSGRSGFADRILQSVNLIGVFSRYYTRGCLVTIDATMQVYPAGLRWLKDATPTPPKKPAP